MIKFWWLQVLGNIEILQRLNPLLLLLQKVHSNGVRPQLMRTSRRPVRVIVHRPLHRVPVLPSFPPSHPISEHSVFGAFQVVPRNLRNANPLHNVPWNQVPHSRHIVMKWIHAPTRNHVPVIQILSGQWPQRLHQFVKPQVNVVVRLHYVMVRRRWPLSGIQHLRQAREVRIRLALIHVLRAVEDDYVVVPHYLQRNQDFLVFLREVAEHELDVDLCSGRWLGAVDHAEEVPAMVLVGEGQDSDEDPDVVGGGIQGEKTSGRWWVVGEECAAAELQEIAELDFVNRSYGAEEEDEEEGGDDETASSRLGGLHHHLLQIGIHRHLPKIEAARDERRVMASWDFLANGLWIGLEYIIY